MLTTLESMTRTHVAKSATVRRTHNSVEVEHAPSFRMSITPRLDSSTGKVSFVIRGDGQDCAFDDAMGAVQLCDVACLNHKAMHWSRVG